MLAMRFSLTPLYMNLSAWLLTLVSLLPTLFTQAASDTVPEVLFVGSEPRYSVGSTPLFLVDESRPFDLNAYRFCGLMTDSSGNTQPSTTNALGTRICKDGSADCLIKGKRIIYGHLWFPLKTGTYPREPERYCDRFFGRDGGRCQDSDNPGSIEYHSVFLPYQLTLGPVLPTVSQADKSKAIKNLWNTPTGSQLVTLENAQFPSEKFPLIIMNGGDTGKYHEQAVAAQELAKNGYIVVVLDNMGNSTLSQVGKYTQFSTLNPDVMLKAGGVNPVLISSLSPLPA
jgi:hypothetical protein